jgi:Holliday junction resolvase
MQTNSEKQEHRIANALRTIFGVARRQPGSGNTPCAPNDVAVVNEMHVECKTTDAKSMTVQHEWITHATKRALMFGVPAVVAVNFAKFGPTDYFLVKDTDYYSMLRAQQDADHAREDVLRLKAQLRQRTSKCADAYESQLP